MFPALRTPLRRRTLAAAGATTALVLTLSACGGSSSHGGSHGTEPSATASAHSSSSAKPGTEDMHRTGDMAAGGGLSSTSDGYRLTGAETTLPSGKRTAYRFTVDGPDGRPVTDFAVDQTKRMHFYAIRSDLTGYQHLHPAMTDGGTWTADLAALSPGSWRLFASFTPTSGAGKGKDLVLSRTLTVPGKATSTALPKASTTTTVDGYEVTVKGTLMAGMAHPLTVTISKDGKPVTDLEPYLETYAHLTAFHQGDQAFAHLHPEDGTSGGHGDHDRSDHGGHGAHGGQSGPGGPTLPFHAELAKSGNWRLFLQFQTEGKLHTAAITLHVG